MRRTIRLLSIVLSIATFTLGVAAAPALAAPEDAFVSKINATRSANGLAPLEVYWDLADDAEAHSAAMKAASDLYHNPNLGSVTSGWSALAENVGVGPDVARLHTAFMESPGHRKNILGNYNYVGVGVVRESDTKIWVTVVFMRGPEGLVSPPAEEPPAEEPPAVQPPAEEPPAEEPPAVKPPAPKPKPQPPKPTTVQAATSPEPVERYGHPGRCFFAI
ncbi:MAG: CAP domain-containing protein [Acidimicrobiia bacterium]|nr:CAP domain-containing protein [Acidimicrobiia bacterium]